MAEDSCLAQAMIAAGFGGLFGGMVGGTQSTYSPNLYTSNRAILKFMGQKAFFYGMMGSTFMGALCVSESITNQKGPHNAVAAGVTLGTVAALLRANYRFGLALGGFSALTLSAVEILGPVVTRNEKTAQKFELFPSKKESTS